MHYCVQGRHALIIFEGARGGGGVVMWHTAATIALVFSPLFIQNIPKHINYRPIMKYLDCHLDFDGQSSLM